VTVAVDGGAGGAAVHASRRAAASRCIASSTIAYLHGVITVHGVTTTGKWQKQFGTIASDNLIRTEHVDFSYRFPTLRPMRRADLAADDFAHLYDEQRRWKFPVSAVGHSFGTLVIGRVFQIHPDLVLNRVILSSSILECAFPWCAFLTKGRVNKILNEHCKTDRVVPLSLAWRLIGLPTGKSGCVGFDEQCGGGVSNVHYKHVGHNRLSKPLHMEKAWVPFLLHGTVPEGDSD
jgi:pimeloyl-ACP methyl ester carboxylesterase